MKVQLHKPLQTTQVYIPVNSMQLIGELAIPPHAIGLVIFAHGSGSGRLSPRNQLVARKLRQDSIATLLVDLLSEEEDTDYQNRFDINLLAERLTTITDWATHDGRTSHLKIGYFGASTGAAAAMISADGAEDIIGALVSRGGRVDLAPQTYQTLAVPTMLIVGEHDYGVREANEEVFLKLKCYKELGLIPKATHLFEEPGTLERVAELASTWFKENLKD